MKKLLILGAFLFCGCMNKETRVNELNQLGVKGVDYNVQIEEFEYKGCEYIAFGQGHGLTITHKGNCKYCEKRNK